MGYPKAMRTQTSAWMYSTLKRTSTAARPGDADTQVLVEAAVVLGILPAGPPFLDVLLQFLELAQALHVLGLRVDEMSKGVLAWRMCKNVQPHTPYK